MAIAEEDVARVRAATDLVALVSEHSALKRVGRRFVGLCPFHAERSPSFSVNAEEGLYHCFGCQASGDAISFVRAMEGCDFVEAVERLAARAGITLRSEDPAEAARRDRRQALYAALEAAEAFYHDRLLSHPDAGPARHYLRSRGYDGAIVRRFRLGFAPAGFDELVRHLRFPPAVLREAGLAHDTSRGRLQDSFRERVMFPILDASGRPIAFGGRLLPEQLRQRKGDAGPKYRNSPESPIYSKRRTLYGLSWSKREIATRGEAVVCEGYTDVIAMFSAGVPNAVATCGTALTEDHLRLLSRFAPRVVLAFDADKAGQAAAARLYDWERRHEVELAVASLPEGSDPADLARDDPNALAAAVRDAQPFLAFQVERALASVDPRVPEVSAHAAEVAIEAVAAHPNELVRDRYVTTIADRTGHDPNRLRALLDKHLQASAALERPASSSATRPPRLAHSESGSRAGRDALLLAVHEPERVAQLLEEVLFVDPVQAAAFRALTQATELRDALFLAEPEAAALLSRLAASEVPDDLDAEGTVIELTRQAAEAALRRLEADARLVAPSEGAILEDLQRHSAFVSRQVQLLRDPSLVPGASSPARDAARALLAWLRERQLHRPPQMEGR